MKVTIELGFKGDYSFLGGRPHRVAPKRLAQLLPSILDIDFRLKKWADIYSTD